MLRIRRIPGILYKHKFTVYSACLILFTCVYLSFKLNVLCVNLQAWRHVTKLCRQYEEGLAVGSLCAPLCLTRDMHSLTCHSFEATKEAVFSAEWHDIRLVFKSVPKDVKALHWYDNGAARYPSEKDFLQTIRAIVKNKFNLTVAYDTAVRLSRLKPSYEEKDAHKRRKEMDNLWLLLQDNEYLLSALFTDKDVFPQLLGTCGPYFAVEYLDPIPTISSYLTYSDDTVNWGKRLKLAVQILELLDKLETNFREPFHLCDLKLEHFGVVRDQNALKFIDLDGVLPKSVVNAIINDVEYCGSDSDCDFIDCRSRCDDRNRCSSIVANDNLQIVCEKIFLGWKMANTILVPGLLMSQHTPSELASLLRQCANPDSEEGKPRTIPDLDIKKRLYSALSEIEQTVNNDFFL